MSDQWDFAFAGGKAAPMPPPVAEKTGHEFVIGVDPGKGTTGWARYSLVTHELVELGMTDFWKFHYWARDNFDPCRVRFVVENAALNKFTYGRHEKAAKEGGDEVKVMGRLNRNAGANGRESELLIEGLRLLGFQVEERRPTKATKKKDAVEFERITKWGKPTNPHKRDAALLVWGM